jgi:hypothetical protein
MIEYWFDLNLTALNYNKNKTKLFEIKYDDSSPSEKEVLKTKGLPFCL